MSGNDFFKDKVVAVTGAASGIGLATARAFVEGGAQTYLLDLNLEVNSRAQELGHGARAIQLDVTDSKAVAQAVDQVVAQCGRLDILVNNAGICLAKPATELEFSDWHKHLDVNLWGVINGVQAALPHMLRQGQGHLVNIASMAGLLPFPMVAPYCASKFAVVGLSESLAAELSPKNIRVTVVCPGSVRTGLLDQARKDMTGERSQAVVKMFELVCASPEKQAQEILGAIRSGQTILMSPGLMRPLQYLQKGSRELYNKLFGLAARLAS